MKKILITILLLISTNLVFAQQNWNDVDLITPEPKPEPTKTTFSIEIDNDDVADTVSALCSNAGYNECTPGIAHQVAVNYFKQQLKDYRLRIRINSITVPEGDIV